jgi:hypothetical protein
LLGASKSVLLKYSYDNWFTGRIRGTRRKKCTGKSEILDEKPEENKIT